MRGETKADFCSPLEDTRFMARALGIGKGTDCLGGFVVVCEEEVIQACVAESFQEPFSEGIICQWLGGYWGPHLKTL